MRIYLSGPMRGVPDNNFPLFNATAKALRAAGHDVLNPAESFGGKSVDRATCLRHDIMLVLVVDAVAVLPGWGDSPGARLEVAEAWATNLPVYEAASLVLGPLDEAIQPREIAAGIVMIPSERQYYERLPLIGLHGYAGSGKDEVAKTLVENGWSRVAFADPLKDIANAIGWSGQKDEEGRKFLQDLGVGVRDFVHSDVWVWVGEERIEAARTPVVVTDVRFRNELQMIHRRRGTMIHVHRPGIGPANEHVSEHTLSEADCDITLHNDGSLEDLPTKVEELLWQLGLQLYDYADAA